MRRKYRFTIESGPFSGGGLCLKAPEKPELRSCDKPASRPFGDNKVIFLSNRVKEFPTPSEPSKRWPKHPEAGSAGHAMDFWS